MSFSMTTQAVYDRQKTVTRRLGWNGLKPGTILNAVEKGMGLKKGEKVKRICQIRVVSVRSEPLLRALASDPAGYGEAELLREGFPHLTLLEFVDMFCKANGCEENTLVNRIEFEYVEPADA
jgi:hypothetical protein